MKYMGSKRRIASQLYQCIITHSGLYKGYWVEPFVGGGNMIQAVPPKHFNLFEGWTRFGNDINKYVVACLDSYANKNWVFPHDHVSKELYLHIRDNLDKYPPEEVGFIGIYCAFGSQFLSNFAKCRKRDDDYIQEGKNNLGKQAPFLKGVKFTHGDYRDCIPDTPPQHTIIYCDPPYQNTSGYTEDFYHWEFYQWLRELKAKGYHIYVSELSMPNDFKEIFSVTLNHNFNSIAYTNLLKEEKLFTL